MSLLRTAVVYVLLVSSNAVADEGLIVAVASNFQATAKLIGADFTQATQIPVRFSAGSTGKLYAQIINGAPYDLFLAADTARPLLLEESGAAVDGSRFTYAIGHLVLWSADASLNGQDCLEALQSGTYRRLAVANPRTAPYGQAAQEFLQAIDVFGEAESRLVRGENISQTLQFVVTGNVTLALVAQSQLAGSLPATASCSWDVPANTHSPLEQQAVILAESGNKAAATRFMQFLKTEHVASILQLSGYSVPE